MEFTDEQIEAVCGEISVTWAQGHWQGDRVTSSHVAAHLILQARARIAELEGNPYYDGTKGVQSGKWDGAALRRAAAFWEKECIQARAERDWWQKRAQALDQTPIRLFGPSPIEIHFECAARIAELEKVIDLLMKGLTHDNT